MDTEAVSKKKITTRKRKPRPRPSNAICITLWTDNGSPLSDVAVKQFEDAIERVQFELFNDGIRVLTQTTKA